MKAITLLALFIFLLASCSGNDLTREKTEKELQQELFEIECANPLKYLKGDIIIEPKYKYLLSSKVDGLKLKVTIKNTASFATYKNIKLEIKFKSESGATVLKREFELYEFFPDRSTKSHKREFSITNQQWEDLDIDKSKWRIISAECDKNKSKN